MASRERRVLEIGFGDGARLCALSVRHGMRKIDFLGIDTDLLPIFARRHNSNLETRKEDAVEFVSKEPDASYFHAYSLFTLKYIPFKRRPSFIHHLKRILQPGRHFAAVEDSEFVPQLREEFERAGFKTIVEELTAGQLDRLGSRTRSTVLKP